MQLLFRTWNHIIPLTVVTNKTLKIGDVVEVRGQKYYVNCQPKTISPSSFNPNSNFVSAMMIPLVNA